MTLEPTVDVIVDEDVTFVFRLTNTAGEAVTLTFRSGQTGDVAVYDADTDELVWEWSSDRMVTQAIHDETIDPGESLAFEYRWTDPLAGAYTAVATLESDVDASARTTFSV